MQHAQTPIEKNDNGTKATLPHPPTTFTESMFLHRFCVDKLFAMLPMKPIFVSLFYIRLKTYLVYSNENNNKFDFQLISVAIVLCTNIFFVYFYTQVKLHDNGVNFCKNPSRKKNNILHQ